MSHELGDWAGAYVLGALEPTERSAFEAHLSDCPECRDAVTELAPLPGLLARTSAPEDAPAPGAALGLAVAGVASERRHLRRARRWWQLVALGSAAAVVALVLFLVVDDEPVRDGPSGDRVALAVASPTATAEIDLLPRPWGSVVDIHVVEVSEAPATDSFTAWVVAEDGHWEPACSWGLDDDGWARVQGASSIRVEEVAEVVITPTDDRTVTFVRGIPPGS